MIHLFILFMTTAKAFFSLLVFVLYHQWNLLSGEFFWVFFPQMIGGSFGLVQFFCTTRFFYKKTIFLPEPQFP